MARRARVEQTLIQQVCVHLRWGQTDETVDDKVVAGIRERHRKVG